MTSQVVVLIPALRDHRMMNTTKPHVVISPAMGVPASFYAPLVESFAEHGWSATVVPRRGIEPGAPPPSRRNDWSYVDEAGDLAAAVAELRASDADRPVVVLGHSLGAQLCALLVTDPDLAFGRPDAVVTVAGSVPWFRCYSGGRKWLLYLTGAAVPVVTAVEGRWPAQLFGGPTPRTLMREWARMVRTGIAPIPDAEPAAPIPTLAVRLAGDALVSVDAAQLLERHFADGALQTWTYTRGSCPEGGSTDHVRWVRTPAAVVERVVDWWAGSRVAKHSTTASRST